MTTLLASNVGGVSWFLLLVYGPAILGGLLFATTVGGFIYSSIKGRRR